MQILLAVDGSADSQAAVAEVARRPWPTGSAVKIIAVVKLPFVPTAETRSLPESDYTRLEEAMREQAGGALRAAAAQLQHHPSTLLVTTEILLGQPVEEILAEAQRWPADLIVLGPRGLGGFKRLLLGSTSHGVLQQASCSVLLVRPARNSETTT